MAFTFDWMDQASEISVKRPRKEKIETVSKMILPDGRAWEVRASYTKHAGNLWIPSVWVRRARRVIDGRKV